VEKPLLKLKNGLIAALAADQLLMHEGQPVWVKYSQRTTLSAAMETAAIRARAISAYFTTYLLSIKGKSFMKIYPY